MEILDVVDDNNEVIGQMERLKCHKENCWHRAVSVFIFKDETEKEILIQRRSEKMEKAAGKLEIFGGHLTKGDSYESGLKREIQEELFKGKILPDLKFEELFVIKKTEDEDYEFLKVYKTHCSGPFFIDTEEVSECYFEDFYKVLEDAKVNPSRYSETAVRLFKEYESRFF